MTPTDIILVRLRDHGCKPHRSGSGWKAHCPAHADANPSLSISTGDEGTALVKCHAGCSFRAVMGKLGLSRAELSPAGHAAQRRKPRSRKSKGRIVATYDYVDETGTLLMQVVRLEPKDFRQRRPDGNGGWVWSLRGTRVVPYRLPELLAATDGPIFVVEGERDVDSLRELGLTATCCAGGAGKWKTEHAAFLDGRHVVVIPDNDEPGRRHAQTVVQSLRGVAASTRILELPGLCEKGDVSDWLEAGGTKEKLLRLLDETPEAPIDDEPVEHAALPGERQRIEISPDEHRVIEQAVSALATDPRVFQRGGVLVRLVDGDESAAIDRVERQPRLKPMDVANVREALARNIYFFSVSGDDEEERHRHPPTWCSAGVASRGEWPGIRNVTGITRVPIIRPDGTVLEVAGYDKATEVLYVPGSEYPSIPEAPTRDEAFAAAERILDLVSDFPFAGPEHRSAWLAALLTPLARYAFEGPAPLFLIDANTRGSGKSLLADVIGAIVWGRPLPRMPCPQTDDEMRKRITAIALGGNPVVLLDNVAGSLGCASLDAVLTGILWEDRILGGSEIIRVPIRASWYATGNNVALRGDTSRRTILVRLESPEERPEERTGFKHQHLLAHIQENQGQYLADALTCVRAYFAAGCPDIGLRPFGSYDGWSGCVRDSICFLGLPDPIATRQELIARSDRSADQLAALVEGLSKADPDQQGLTSAEIAALVDGGDVQHENLRAAVLEALDGPGKPSARRIGNLLGKYRGRVYQQRCIDCRKPGGVARWYVRLRISDGASKEQQEPPEQQPDSDLPTAAGSENDRACGSSGSGCSDSGSVRICPESDREEVVF